VTDNSKYNKNRNLWRRSYPIGIPRRPPVIANLYDEITETSYSLDLQQTIRHRDYFKIAIQISGVLTPPVPPFILGEYDEDLIHFNNEVFKNFTFNFVFSNEPILVFSQGTAAPAQPNTENINIYGIAKNTSGGVVGLSAPYSGTIRYRAAYAATYPSVFTGSVASIAPTAGTFIASVFRDMPDNESFITASWAPLASSNPDVFMSPYDDNSNFDGNVILTASVGTLSNSGKVIEISAPMSSSIYVIAVE
jgi:hypothetical protein